MYKFTKKSGVLMIKHINEVKEFFNKRTIQGIKPGLSRMEQLLKYVDHPERRVKFIHVAGTNGKGSTIQYIKAGLRANQIDVGVFSSPSLDGLLGHITINDRKIKEEEFIENLNRLLPKIKEMDQLGDSPTEFEIITAIAFTYFAKVVSVAIIEAGMGGKGDTTNCIKPILSVITNISIDHKQFLGNTIIEITEEKAGIIKEGIQVITGEVSQDPLLVLKKQAELKNSPFVARDEHYFIKKIHINNDTINYCLNYEQNQYKIQIKTRGTYQIKNSSLAAIALIELKKMNFPIRLQATFKEFTNVSVPGRFEKINECPLVFVDGAHNEEGIKAFIETIKEGFNQEKKVLIFSAFKDKEVDKMLPLLLPHFDEVILTTFNHPRAFTMEQLKSLASKSKINIRIDNLPNIVKDLKLKPKNVLYFFTGSLYFVKNVKKYFN